MSEEYYNNDIERQTERDTETENVTENQPCHSSQWPLYSDLWQAGQCSVSIRRQNI